MQWRILAAYWAWLVSLIEVSGFQNTSPELDTPVAEALTQHFQESHYLRFPAKTINELPLAVGDIDLLKPLPWALGWLVQMKERKIGV